MDVRKLAEGLWYWNAPHPDWKPESAKKGGWEQAVGCVHYEGPDAVVLIDPLAPPDGTPEATEFWTALDRDVARLQRPVAVLLTNHFHQRSSAKVAARYPGTSVHGSKHLVGKTERPVDRTFDDGDVLPGGVKARSIRGMEEDETAFYIPAHKAYVFGDAAVGIGDGSVRVVSRKWAPEGDEASKRYEGEFRQGLRKLLNVPIDMLLVSHGEPVTSYGSAALAEALEAEAWGEE
jgi:hypothetical protein